AVTVAGGDPGVAGRYVTCAPLVPESDPGPASDQTTPLASSGGLALITVGPEIVWVPEGAMVNAG
ncbi:MAG: hypothetical protein ACJ79C_04710, partial [Myxococcales bacterium]